MSTGPLMLDLEGTNLTTEERALLLRPAVGGVIFFARNFESREQIQTLASEIREVRADMLLAVDQEGGRVQRFRAGFTRLPPMQVLGDLARQNPDQGLQLCHDTGWLMASEILACGIDFSFAPVLDVDRDTCEVIGDRSFSDDPQHMVHCARAFIAGMHEAGMAATGKHFPGHGSVLADSHLETPYDNRDMSAVRGRDLVPFQALSGDLDAIMPAHMVFPEIDSRSVGFSPYWLQDVLRGELGFQGVIFSDDLSMKGADIAGGYADKAKLALSAGCDMVLVCNNRAGALEVLDMLEHMLEQQTIQPAERLATMASRSKQEWSELTSTDRYCRIQRQIDQLTEQHK